MSTAYNPLPLYYDSQCTQPIPSRTVGDSVFYEMRLGAIKTRAVSYSDFYMKNRSLANVENISIDVKLLDVDGGKISVSLASVGEVKQLGAGEVYHGLIKWDVGEGVRASPRRVGVGIMAEITRE